MIDVSNTLALHEGDPGTGMMLGDPLPFIHGFHRRTPLPIRTPLPHRDPLPHTTPPDGPGMIAPISIRRLPLEPANPEQNVENGTNLNNAGTWAGIAQGFGPSQSVLNAINQSASSGGANMMMGPQMDFAPADAYGGNASSGGGTSPIVLVGVIVVGVLLWMHFRKKHEHTAA